MRLGIAYLNGGVLLAVASWWLAPWGLGLAWPAVSLLLVAAAYLGLGPRVFGKRQGRVRLLRRAVLGPYLGVLWLWRVLDRFVPTHAPVTRDLYLGRLVSRREAEFLVGDGVTAVLDLTAEHGEAAPFRQSRYRNVPVLDLILPTVDDLRAAVDFYLAERTNGPVYVHCAQGLGRSAVVAGACLVALEPDRSFDDVRDTIVAVRPRVRLHEDEVRALIETFRRELQ